MCKEWSGLGPGSHLAAGQLGWQLSYSSLEVCAGCLSFRRSKKGSRKSAEHTVKQTWAPVSQYTVERGVKTQAFYSPVPAPTNQAEQAAGEGCRKDSVNGQC